MNPECGYSIVDIRFNKSTFISSNFDLDIEIMKKLDEHLKKNGSLELSLSAGKINVENSKIRNHLSTYV